MAEKSKAELKALFENGDILTEAALINLIDSFPNRKELSVTNPISEGAEADIDTIGSALDGTRWIKVGENDTDWEQILISSNGDFEVNIELADAEDQVLSLNQLGQLLGEARIGDGSTKGGLGIGSQYEIPFTLGADASGNVRMYDISGTYNNGDIDSGFEQVVILGNKITTVGSNSFSYSGTSAIHLPESLIEIQLAGLEWITDVTEIHLPSKLQIIGGSSFYNMGISEITIPQSVVSISEAAFEECANLETVNAYITKDVFDDNDNNSFVLLATAEPLTIHVRTDDNSWDALVAASPSAYQGNNAVTVIKDL